MQLKRTLCCSLMQSLQADAEAKGTLFSFGTKVLDGDMKSFPKELRVQNMVNGEKTTIMPECIVNAAGETPTYKVTEADLI